MEEQTFVLLKKVLSRIFWFIRALHEIFQWVTGTFILRSTHFVCTKIGTEQFWVGFYYGILHLCLLGLTWMFYENLLSAWGNFMGARRVGPTFNTLNIASGSSRLRKLNAAFLWLILFVWLSISLLTHIWAQTPLQHEICAI